jgi:hypothetical protein
MIFYKLVLGFKGQPKTNEALSNHWNLLDSPYPRMRAGFGSVKLAQGNSKNLLLHAACEGKNVVELVPERGLFFAKLVL